MTRKLRQMTVPEMIASIDAWIGGHNRAYTPFDEEIADLERVWRERLAQRDDPTVPVEYKSQEWYAYKITTGIAEMRDAAARGDGEREKLEIRNVFVLAREGDAQRKRTKDARNAGLVRGEGIKENAADLDNKIRRIIDRYEDSDETLTIERLAELLTVTTRTIRYSLGRGGIQLKKKD